MNNVRREYRLGKRAIQVEQTRASLLEAARNRLVRDGAANLVMRDVAKDAGVTEPTIFSHFGSKLGLLNAITRELATRGEVDVPIVQDVVAIADPCEALREFIRSICRLWDLDRELFRQIVSLSVVDEEMRMSTLEYHYELVTTLVERLADHGQLRPGFETHEASVMVSSITSFPVFDELVTRLEIGHNGAADLLIYMVSNIVNLESEA